MMMAELEEEYARYVFEMQEQGIEPMSMQQFMEQAMAEGQMSSAQPMAPQAMPPRQMAAYGGIMGMDGRRQYGLGSSFKKFVRKIIPNEVADIAVKAAPFVAPFNPLAAGLMSGIGSFDQTGKIGSSLKSGLMNYGLGNVSRMLGGAGFQGGLKASGTGTGFGSYFTSPTTGKQLFGQKIPGLDSNKELANKIANRAAENQAQATGLFAEGEVGKNLTGNIVDEFANVQTGGQGLDSLTTKVSPLKQLGNKIKDYAMNNKLATFLLAKEGMDLLGGPEETVSEIMDRGEGLDLASIRAEVQEAFADNTGEKLKALKVKYPYLGEASTKLAEGGRIGKAEGGLMDLGGMEKDYRAEGGFVPIGKAEKADDVPARLSVNEFVFTADAVRNAGGGDIDKGAKVMENMMKNLEAGGQVSEESQGMAGAQQMFETSQRLSEVM